MLSASIRASDVWLVLFPLVVSFALLFGPALVLPVSFWLKLVYPNFAPDAFDASDNHGQPPWSRDPLPFSSGPDI